MSFEKKKKKSSAAEKKGEECVSSHSINGFLTDPTRATPMQLMAFGSEARTIVASGNIGFSALTCEASLAACSMASISALHMA